MPGRGVGLDRPHVPGSEPAARLLGGVPSHGALPSPGRADRADGRRAARHHARHHRPHGVPLRPQAWNANMDRGQLRGQDLSEGKLLN